MKDILSTLGDSQPQKFEFYGFYRQGYFGGPDRPFVRVAVALPNFDTVRIIEMLVDTGSDTTTLAARDSVLLLKKAQFKQLSGSHEVLGVSGFIKVFKELAAVGILLPGERICWVPILIDINKPSANQEIPSTLGQDILQFGEAGFDAVNKIIKITLWLSHPLVTSG